MPGDISIFIVKNPETCMDLLYAYAFGELCDGERITG